MRNVAVVLAGGMGRRIGRELPKQLIDLAGRPILEHTLLAFQRAPEIDEIMVLMVPGYVNRVPRLPKVARVLEGGASRTETTIRAIDALEAEDLTVLLHDAARPLVDGRIIADCVAALREYEAVNVAIPSSDTIITVEGDRVSEVPDRARLRRVQTPQGFRLPTLRRAYELARRDPAFTEATDDCAVVLRYLPDVPIHVIPGSERNMKITGPMDLAVAELLLRRRG